jgi:dTDP-4-amino-4,6-dideoxygalactose transaminase
MIRFNKPYFTGNEITYIKQAIDDGRLSGNNAFSKKCHNFFEQKYGFKKVLLTTSCTDALEMASILIDLKPDDEVIVPSYTFVSSANAFVLRGAKIVFADSEPNNPNIDANTLEALITPKTKAIIVVHYAGVACDMDAIMALANKHNIFVIEDAAQAIDSYYKGKALGSIGHLSAFSFHETKNIITGEGGLLVINDERFIQRAEIIWEKGTNRSAFYRGEIDKYGWVDVGSSFLPSDMIAAFLYAQLENIDDIQNTRKAIWERYYKAFIPLAEKGCFQLPSVPSYATNNAHMFYLVCTSSEQRHALIQHLKANGVHAVFHYLSLHKSPFYHSKHDKNRELPYCDNFADCLIRLPLFYELNQQDQDKIISEINNFFLAQTKEPISLTAEKIA